MGISTAILKCLNFGVDGVYKQECNVFYECESKPSLETENNLFGLAVKL